jgi:hypothetical protein
MTISIVPSIETQSTFFKREIKFFPIRKLLVNFLKWLLTRYLHKLNSLLDEVYTDIQGALVVLKNYTTEDALRDLPSVKKAIKLLITYKSLLEKAEYLGSKDVETKINLVISALYDAEIQMKKKVFSGQPRTSAQPELLEAMASASKEALRSSLSN